MSHGLAICGTTCLQVPLLKCHVMRPWWLNFYVVALNYELVFFLKLHRLALLLFRKSLEIWLFQQALEQGDLWHCIDIGILFLPQTSNLGCPKNSTCKSLLWELHWVPVASGSSSWSCWPWPLQFYMVWGQATKRTSPIISAYPTTVRQEGTLCCRSCQLKNPN